MAKIPGWLYRHRIKVQRHEGEGAYGPVYAEPVTLKGLVEDEVRLVRDRTGAEVVSSTSVILPPSTADIPAESLVTVPSGRTTRVIIAARADGAGLPTPDHLELFLE